MWSRAANALSLSRVGMAAALWLAPSRPGWLLGLSGLAAASDVADGWVARAGRTRRFERGGPRWLPSDDTGAWLDPLCDKVFVVSLVAAAWLALEVPTWRLALIATRELLLVPVIAAGFAAHPHAWRRLDFHSSWSGKLATVAQFSALAAIVLGHPAQGPLAIVAALLGAGAVIGYVKRALRSNSARSRCRSTSRPPRTRWSKAS